MLGRPILFAPGSDVSSRSRYPRAHRLGRLTPFVPAVNYLLIVLAVIAVVALAVTTITAVHARRQAEQAACAAKLEAVKARTPLLKKASLWHPSDACLALGIFAGEGRP